MHSIQRPVIHDLYFKLTAKIHTLFRNALPDNAVKLLVSLFLSWIKIKFRGDNKHPYKEDINDNTIHITIHQFEMRKLYKYLLISTQKKLPKHNLSHEFCFCLSGKYNLRPHTSEYIKQYSIAQ